MSDRFHLLKNLTDYCKEYLNNKFKSNIIVDEKIKNNTVIQETTSECSKNRCLTLEQKWEKAKELLTEGIAKSSICKQLNMDIRVFNKLFDMNDNELKSYFTSTLEKRQEAIRTKKMELITLVRDLYSKHYSMRKIADMLNIDRKTVKKYVDIDFIPIHVSYGTKREGILDAYLDEIHELFKKDNTSKMIFQTISNNGYTGSYSTLRHYLAKLKKANETSALTEKDKIEKIIVKRNDLLKLLYSPEKNIKGLSAEIVNKAKKRYPFFEEVINLIVDFKEILKSKKIKRLDEWILIAKSLNNKYINSFINGITRDLEAVKNAIIYDYNNGLAEGSVNKLKIIKRIMYGRNNFDMLRKKLLLLEQKRKIN